MITAKSGLLSIRPKIANLAKKPGNIISRISDTPQFRKTVVRPHVEFSGT